MNALRHGLTGQVLLMPEENLVAFQDHCKIFVNHYQPQTLMEQRLVHQIATLQWRIDRAMTLETNMLALGEFENGVKFDAKHAETNTAVMEVSNYRDMQERFALNTLYEQRLTRLYERAVRELKQLQYERKCKRTPMRTEPRTNIEPRPKEAFSPQPSPTNQAASLEIGFVSSAPAITAAHRPEAAPKHPETRLKVTPLRTNKRPDC